MTRRDFLKRLGLAASAVALSPMLDLASIETVVEAVCYEPYEYQVIYMFNIMTHNPRRLGMISSIT